MVVVKIELHSAVTGQVSELDRLVIYNDSTGNRDLGNYVVADRDLKPQGSVHAYPRLTLGVRSLLLRALNSVLPADER